MKIVQLQQGSPEWHEHRRTHRNASETATVLGLSPWQTAYQLWAEKTGRTEPAPATEVMAHGTRMEPRARAAYEARTGLVMEPLVVVDGEYSASLDGMTLDGKLILEVKCPAKGKASGLWQAVSAGEVPEHYYWQLQSQLLVSGAELAHLFVFVEDDAVLLEHKPDPDSWQIARSGWSEFWHFVATDSPPPLTDRDTVIRTDEEWNVAAHDFVLLHGLADDVAQRLDAAKKKLIALAQHTSETGAGVSVSRFWKSGSIDYKKLVAAVGVDVGPYRLPARQETRVSVVK